MSSSSPLSNEQIEHFKTHGFLVLKSFIEEIHLEGWRQQIWNELASSIETPENWPRERTGLDGYEYKPHGSDFGLHPKLWAVVEQLGGGDYVLGDGIPIIRWPDPEQTWEKPTSGHLDAYGSLLGWSPFMFGATMYLYDVESKGGSFFYWPDSHYSAHRYFREHPKQVDGTFLEQEGFSWKVFCENSETGGQEFVANAGDVVLWHAYLTHESSANIRNSPRIALFARWYHKRWREENFRYDIPDDLWKHWAI